MSLAILFLTAQLPYPPRLGGALRNHGMLVGLAQGQRVSLLSLLEPGQPDPAATPLAEICDPLVTVPAPRRRTRAQRLRDLLSGQADMARRLWSDAYADALRQLLAAHPFDVIHVGGLEMAPYLPVLRQSGFTGLVVFDNYNAEAALQRRIFEVDLRTPWRWHAALYSLVQWRRLVAFETHACQQADHVLAVSEADARLLRALRHHAPVTVIPNAIDVPSYDANCPPADLPHPALVFTGKMDYRPNVDAALWFADEVLPRIQRRVPEAHFAIVGQQPHPRLAPLQVRPDVTLTGAVDNVRPYIAAADVYVVPMRMGSGTRFKILEAMAMRRAIVSTTLGAQGLEAESGRHLLVADDAGAFAEAVVTLLGDDARRASLGHDAHSFVAQGYDWGRIIPRLEVVYEAA